MTKFKAALSGVGSILLGLTLISLGIVELTNPSLLGAVATWGYAERFGVLLASVEIGGGLLLLLPRVAWYSATLLGTLLAAAIATHLWNGQTESLVPATALLVGVALVGYTRHPRAMTLSRVRAAADALAEREIAQERQRLKTTTALPDHTGLSLSAHSVSATTTSTPFTVRSKRSSTD